MTVKQNLGSTAPDGSHYVTLADGDGNLSSVTISASDIEIGAVEIKNSTTDDRVTVSAAGALKVDASSVAVPITDNSGSLTVDYATTGSGTSTGALRVELPTNGTGVVKIARSTTGAKSNVASSATSVTVLASNSSRLGASVYNDSTQILYLDLTGGTASSSSYSLQLAAGSWYILDAPWYTGAITGLWASANGNARVTEWT